MIRDITIGQYYPAESPIHRLDARFKIIAAFLFIVSLFIVDTIMGYICVSVLLGIVIRISKVPFKFMVRGLKSIMIIILFTAVINLFLTQGEQIIWQFGVLHLTVEGIYMAVKMCVRLVLLIIGSSLLTLTTTPIQLTDGLEYLLHPLKKIGVPAHEIAMMMTIALRFIPTLLDETDKIIKAQQARGADFDTGNMMQKAKSMIPILVPLFISAFRRAEELAMAMEARCYHGDENRTRMNVMRMQRRDYQAMVWTVVYLCIVVGLRVAVNFFPQMI